LFIAEKQMVQLSSANRAGGTLLAVLVWCFLAMGCRAPQSVVAGAGGVAVRTDALGWFTKKVVAKRPPEALLAEDGTMCRVAPDRFRDTAEGALVHCNWQ
jgi:hypothetical protein